jgi:uncharacterized protein YjbI with pentapeptide repeats
MKPTWKNLLLAARKVIGLGALSLIIVFAILELYTQPWTGFGDYTTPAGNFVRGKTLWDWMELLIIPVFLGAGAIAVNRSERELERQRTEDRSKLEREIATDRQQEAALQAYLDRMAELLVEKKLRTSKNKEVRDVARIRTLTMLRGLDAVRKGFVVAFLYEAHLISAEKTIIFLANADLSSADLRGILLIGANLLGTDLTSADLTGSNLSSGWLMYATLHNANLSDIYLKGSKLEYSNLRNANLSHSKLTGANLTAADLTDANLTDADLTDAIVTSEQLATAKSLKGATMPDGTKHE